MTRRAAMVALAAVVLAGVALARAPMAGACTLPPGPGPTEQELLSQADLVFEGVAVSRHDPNAGAPIQSSGDPIVWSFAVDREIKGVPSRPQEIRSARSGATCGITFQIGTRYRVFAKTVDGALWMFLGSGTREATTATTSTTTTIAPTTTTTTTVRPATPTRPGRIALTG